MHTIPIDTEVALINAINNNFPNINRLIREARTMGIFNRKNNKINTNITYEIITQLSLLCLKYIGNIKI